MMRLSAVTAALTLTAATLTVFTALPPPRLCDDYAAGNVTIEVLGDSIAAGYGVSASERWSTQLAAQLPGPSSTVWNAAVSGTRVEDYAPGGAYHFHVDFTAAVKPSLVIMNWRANDQWWGNAHPTTYTPATFKARYREILDEIRDASPTTTLALAVSPWILDARIDQGTYSQWDYIVALWELKDEYDAVWLDWMRFMPKAGDSNSAGLLLGDLSHPSAAGQSVMGAATFEFLRSYCQRVDA